jgi:hypothetical protein
LLGVLVLGLLLVQVLRWTALDAQDEALLALARTAPAAAEGRNGFAALALSGYEIPAEAIDAEMAAEVKEYTAWLAGQGEALSRAAPSTGESDEAGPNAAWTPRAANRYPARPAINFDSPTCGLGAKDCLARVRADTGEIRAFMAGESERLALVDQALSADLLSSPYPPSHQAPFPPFTTLGLSLTQAAIDAADGRVPQALSRTCRTLAAARRFTPDARDLLGKMVFPALAEGAAALLLDIRRENPAEPLPDDCRGALQPVQADDYLVCEAMRGEFRMGAALSASQDEALAGRWTPDALLSRWVLLDARLQDAWMASAFAAHCTEDYRREVLAGHVPPAPPRPVSRDDIHCYAAALNCLMVEIALPAYRDYQGRQLDYAAKLRLLLAAQAAVGADATAASLEAAAASPGYEVSADPAARTLAVRQRFLPGGSDPLFSVSY